MLSDPAQTPTQTLKVLMQSAEIASYRRLAEKAGVSRWQIQQLSKGHIQTMRLAPLTQIAAALRISFLELCDCFGLAQLELGQSEAAIASADQSASAGEKLQASALQTLESWLVQWPTIAKRAKDRPDLVAAKILPFIRPVEQLMREWDVEPIAAVDSQVAFDPTWHQLSAGHADPGDLVRVTHTGITHRGALLHRAKVKPI